MRHDIITATLPADPVEAEICRLWSIWSPDELNRAGLEQGCTPGARWTLPQLAAANEYLEQASAQAANMRMLDADAPKPAEPAPAAEDPLVFAVSDAIQALREHMFECAVDECQNTGRRDPDYSRADAAEAHLLKAIDDLIADRLAASKPPVCDLVQVGNFGLLVEHKPGARVKGGAL